MEVDIDQPFTILCRDVLGTRQAYLAAQGPLAELVGNPLTYSLDQTPPIPDFEGLVGPWILPEDICIPFPETTNQDWRWLVPLWSERGLIGILLLGPKRDEGLYAQEEIEIAQTVGERLIDTRASAEMARRLMALQRQRLAENQVVDRRTRRVLHDEVLPQLHSVLISLSGSSPEQQSTIEALTNTHRQIADLLRDLPVITTPEVSRRGLIAALQNTVENEYASAFDRVVWDVPDEAVAQLKQLPALTSEVLYFAAREAIRNAAHHGRAGNLCPSLKFTIEQQAQTWEIIIENDHPENPDSPPIKIGSGQGLAIHSTLMAVIGGELSFEQVPGEVTRVVLRVPFQIQ
jgi:signal transduction histidine kinase